MINGRLDGRLRGAMLGLAVGDAVGAPFEGRVEVDRAEVVARLHAREQLRWTDDTHMALALGRSLIEHGGSVDSQHLGDAFARTYEAEPWRGYGAGPPHVFELARQGLTYTDAANSLFRGKGSFGNGAAMRVAPVAVAAAPDVELVAVLADRQARVTHAHQEAVDGAVFIATAVCLLARASARPAEVRGALTAACHFLSSGPVRTVIHDLLAVAASRGDLLGTAQSMGTGVAARESVPAAVAALLSARDVEGVLLAAVTLGGDTDTVAAMAGAMIGALSGSAAIPGRLLRRLEAHDEIDRLAGELLRRHSGTNDPDLRGST